MEYLNFDCGQISIDPASIEKLLGFRGGDTDEHSLELIDYYLGECLHVSSPTGVVSQFEADRKRPHNSASTGDIQIEGVVFHTGKVIGKMLSGSDHFALFAVTAGPGAEKLARSLIRNNQFLEGYISDLIGSCIAESVAGLLHQHIRNKAESEGLKVTNRYSPGYCSWKVSEQQKLFALLPEQSMGITLSESSLMSPIKSVSGIIGVGPSVGFQEYTCENCRMKHCQFRKSAV